MGIQQPSASHVSAVSSILAGLQAVLISSGSTIWEVRWNATTCPAICIINGSCTCAELRIPAGACNLYSKLPALATDTETISCRAMPFSTRLRRSAARLTWTLVCHQSMTAINDPVMYGIAAGSQHGIGTRYRASGAYESALLALPELLPPLPPPQNVHPLPACSHHPHHPWLPATHRLLVLAPAMLQLLENKLFCRIKGLRLPEQRARWLQCYQRGLPRPRRRLRRMALGCRPQHQVSHIMH